MTYSLSQKEIPRERPEGFPQLQFQYCPFWKSNHSGFQSNLDQFSSTQKCNFFSLKFFLWPNLGFNVHIIYWILKHLEPLKAGLCLFFVCLIFCQANVNSHQQIGGKKLLTACSFFWRGLHRK